MTQKISPKKRDIDGFILVDKDYEISSNRALMRSKGLFRARKAGHAGTLDPLATGMLLICFGEATKFCKFALEANKHYTVEATLGLTTTTSDAEGEVLLQRTVPASLTCEQIDKVLESFRGNISQVPSMYSALKYQGKPYYYWARAGIEVPRIERDIQIFSLRIVSLVQDKLTLAVHCSKGTYIRNLVEDIGEALGCGAYVSQLRRTQIGSLAEPEMQTHANYQMIFDEATAAGEDGLQALSALVRPMTDLFSDARQLMLTDEQVLALSFGRIIQDANWQPGEQIALRHAHFGLVGCGNIDARGICQPLRLCNTEKLRAAVTGSTDSNIRFISENI